MTWYQPWTWGRRARGYDVVLVFHDDQREVRATVKLHVDRPTRVRFTHPVRATSLLISVDDG